MAAAATALKAVTSSFFAVRNRRSTSFPGEPRLRLRLAPSSLSLRRFVSFKPVKAAVQTEIIEEDAVSDWEGDGDVAASGDAAAGWGEAEGVKLFVGNLPFHVDSETLAGMFQEAGIVEVAEVIYDRETDRSRGFGFVTMSSTEEAEKAIQTLDGQDLQGRALTVSKASPRGSGRKERRRSDRIYVGNLPWSVGEDRLEQVFGEYGDVVGCRVVCDRDSGRSRGFAFVTMSSSDDMERAISALDGQNLDGRTLRVNAAEEKPMRGIF